MIYALYAVIFIAAYMAIGRIAARLLAPRLARYAREREGYGHTPRSDFTLYRQLLRWAWPLALPYWINHLGDEALFDRYDPDAIERREKEQLKRIRDLEHELMGSQS